VFFRAKEWDDAIKVLSGMFGFSGIVIKEKLAHKLDFLSEYGVTFGEVTQHIGDGSDSLNWILIAFFIVLYFKNSNDKAESLEINKLNVIYISLLLTLGILNLSKFSEFLYFNF
jgi:hypothetical protein